MRFVKRCEENTAAAEAIGLTGVSPLLARILSMRGVKNQSEANAFLSPSLEQLHDPYAMAGMAQAVASIRSMIAEKKRIVIFGDYDVDGVTATAALLSHLRAMGADAGYYLPSRHGEGYGLSEASVKSLAQSYDCMITVDCGITAIDEVRIAQEAGLSVIVTDHHEPMSQLPDCILVNPKLGYPFRDLCGAGVAGKLIQALGGLEALERVLDLVALGTIADIVPLLDENRILAAEGLRRINQAARPGIAALVEVSGLLGKPLTAGHVSFSIAPRINAGGRIGHSGKSVDMMLTGERALALEIARELDNLNRERQRQEMEITKEALRQAEQQDLRTARVLVLEGEGWNPGVIGIVASRIVERYSRPAFLLAREGEVCVGSGRSVPGVHLFDALQSAQELFERFGGHEMAAGLTIRAERTGEFRRAMQSWMEELEPELFLPTALYDVQADLDEFDIPFTRELERLAPTGQANPAPVFLVRGAMASGARAIGAEGAHLRFALSQGNRRLYATAFKQGDRADVASGLVDALVAPEIDTYSGSEQVRVVARAFDRAQDAFSDQVSRCAGELLRKSISTLECARQAGGFRRHIHLKDQEHMRKTILTMLSQAVGGVLIMCALPQTALEMDAWLRTTSADAAVLRSVGLPAADSAAPHALVCPAIPQGEALAAYSQIVLPDGAWQSGWVERLLMSAPGAAVYAPAIPPQVKEAVSAVVPDVEAVRGLYRLLRGIGIRLKGAGDFGALSGMLTQAGMGEAQMEIALMMLADMGLIRYEKEPFSLRLIDEIQGKRDMNLTPTCRFFTAFCQNG